MNSLRAGLLAGLIFGILDIIPMCFMTFPDPTRAIVGAFSNRFAIGLLVFVCDLKMRRWLSGVVIGALLSLPYAIITEAAGPIMASGIVGGLIIGWIAGRWEARGKQASA